MVGKKSFELNAALAAATDVFWENGYRGASLSELKRATNLGAGSFYNAFGSKHALFLACLEAYGENVIGVRIETHFGKASGPKALRGFFRTAFNDRPREDLRRGCLFVKTAAELTKEDARTISVITAWWARLEDAFAGCLAGPKVQRIAKARGLIAGYQGLILLAMTGADDRDLVNAADAILQDAESGGAYA